MNAATSQANSESSQNSQQHLQTVDVSVLFFAQAREIAGTNKLIISVPSRCSIRHLLSLILAKFPALTDIAQSSVLAVNHQYVEVDSHCTFVKGDEVAFIPPISGG